MKLRRVLPARKYDKYSFYWGDCQFRRGLYQKHKGRIAHCCGFQIETTNEKSSGEKRVIREKMSLASFPWKGNSNKPLSSKKIAGVRTRGKESRSVAA
jgi:hypothetical protein